MTDAPGALASPASADPAALLAALRDDAGSLVEGASAGSLEGAPAVDGLSPARAAAVLSAWTGARLHAGQDGLLVAADPDLALLVGDWCFAHALQSLAHGGDLDAIGRLATAIGQCAVALTEEPVGAGALAAIWLATCQELRAA